MCRNRVETWTLTYSRSVSGYLLTLPFERIVYKKFGELFGITSIFLHNEDKRKIYSGYIGFLPIFPEFPTMPPINLNRRTICIKY